MAVPGTYFFTHQRALAADNVTIIVVQSSATETATYRSTPPGGAARTFVHVKVVKP